MNRLEQNCSRLIINLSSRCNFNFLKVNNKIINQGNRHNINSKYYSVRIVKFNAFVNNAPKNTKEKAINL